VDFNPGTQNLSEGWKSRAGKVSALH